MALLFSPHQTSELSQIATAIAKLNSVEGLFLDNDLLKKTLSELTVAVA